MAEMFPRGELAIWNEIKYICIIMDAPRRLYKKNNKKGIKKRRQRDALNAK